MASLRTRPVLAAGAIIGLVLLGFLVLHRHSAAADAGGDDLDAAAASMVSPGDDAGRESAGSGLAIPVEGVPAERGTLVLSVSAAAEAAPARSAVLLARVAGRVLAVSAGEDASVAAGRALVTLDSTEYVLDRDAAAAQLRQAQASYRELTLFDDRIDDARVRAERAEAARARSGLDAAEVAVRRAAYRLAETRVTAPFAGRVADVKVTPGQWVRPGDPLLTVLDVDPIRVEVQVLEGDLARLRPGGRASVAFSAFPGAPVAGRIAAINPEVDRRSRAATVTVEVANPRGRILPGMYARVSLEARRLPGRVLVPRSAILERDRRTMLFVYAPDGPSSGLAKWRYVTTGLTNDSLVEIVPNPETDSVRPGEIVLTGGQYTLVHDARVRLVAHAAAAGGRPE